YGVKEEDFNKWVDYISENAVQDACTGSNPRTVSVEEMKKIFTCTFNGEKVDF
ncbi:MAG TPA: butanol dehydrogenase, partial [Clostridium sp.]|nr:butanol dehydrogenase [Clostridium sp.]